MKKPAARLLALVVAAATAMSPLAAQRTDAAVVLTVTPLTWNIIGLDSNSPASGPNRFPVGARVCAAGSTSAGAVTAVFVWDSSNPNVALRPGSLATISLGSISAGSCADAYFEVEVTRTAAAFDTTRSYHITATDSVSGATATTPRPRELYVEHLISQSRNGIESIKLNGVSIPAGGSMTLVVGNTYTIELAGHTATQGYNQLESFINFPNTIFQTLAVSTTYTSNTSPYVASPNDKLYADACLWENDPNSPNYRSCVGGDGKAGGTVVTTYTVKIISGAGSSQTLSSLLYDFSGSSYHYNADFGVGFRTANIVAPASVTISKAFTPKAISPGGTSTLTFTLSNPTTDSFTGVNFSDTFPAGLTVAGTPGVAYSGCGSGAFSPVPVAGATSVAFSNGTLAPNGVCTITVDLTAPAGTYDNTTGHLFIDTSIDTGNVGQDTLVASAAPACTPGQTLATWSMPASGQGSGGPPPPFTTRAANVASATASTSAGMTNSIVSGEGNPPNAWAGQGFEKTGTPDGDTAPYFQFAVDTSQYTGVGISLDFKRDPNWGGGSSDTPTMYLYSSTTGSAGSFSLIATTSSLTAVWQSIGNTAAAATGSATTYFRINARGTNSVASSQLFLDNVAVSGCGVPAPAPTIAKSFAPDPIVLGATSTLTFTIANTAVGSRALTGVAFSDVLPAGLSIADSSSAHCGGTVTTTAATRTIALTGGQLSAGASCTFGVAVAGSTEGHYDNATGFISSTEGGTSTNYATDSLTVIAPPEFGKSFSPTSILTGDTSALAFTITNPNRLTALSGIGFSDTLPAGLTLASAGPTATCGGSLTTTAPDSISFSGGSLAANGACTISVTVTGATAGSKVNSTSAVTSTEGGTGNAATATLVVSDPVAVIDLNKQVSSDGINWFKFVGVPVGGPVYYRFSVYNGGDIPFTSISVGDPTLIACTWTGTAYPPLATGETATCVTGPIAAISGLHANTATATGIYATGTASSSPSTGTYGTTELTIAKSAAESYFTAAGNVLHYSYLVTNSGFAPLLGPVTVADDKAIDEGCPGVGTVGDLDNYLDPGESITCTATYTVQPADVMAGSVTNTASATVGGVTSGTSTRTVGLAALTIAKTANPTSTSTTGPISYTITVTNTGTVDLTGVVLGDPLTAGASLVSGDTTDPGVLDVGEVWTYGATYTVTAADLTAGSPIVNTATVDTDQTAPASASATTTIVQGPALAVAKSSTTSSITAAGQVVPYTFSLTNTGNVSLTGITVGDPACDAAPAYVSGDTNSDSTLQTSETWTYACNRTVTQAELDAGGTLSNTVSADSAKSAPATDTLDIPIVQNPALTIAKTANPTSTSTTGPISYTITVTNTGTVDLTGVVLGDPLTAGASLVSGDTTDPGVLDVGEVWTYGATYTVTAADLTAGSPIVNTATVDTDQTAPASASATTTIVQGPALAVAKSSTTSSITAAGQVVPYTFSLTNTGNVSLTGITVGDPACDAAPAYVSGDTNSDSTLQTSETWTYACNRTVTQAELDAGGTLSNTVSADSAESAPATDTLDIPIVQNPALTIAKTANPTSTSTTGPISYTITVTNTGTVDLTGVVLGDPLTAGASLVSGDTTDPGVLDVGEVWTYGATYTVTAADLTAGSPIVNTATVDTDQTAPASASATTTIVQGPALAVAKSSTTSSITAAGQVVPYTFSLTNTGNVSLTGITVGDPACDAAPAYVSGDTNSDSTLQTSETWTYACNRTVTQAELDAGGTLSNTVSADSAESAPATDTLDIPIVQNPALTIQKTITSGARYAAVGDVITYEYRVLNSGNVTVGGPITVTDDRTSVTCPATSSLDPGATVTCTATYSITQNDLSAGSVTNTATATGVFSGGQVASTTVSASARSAASPPLPPSSAFDPFRDLRGGLSAIGAWLLLVAALTTVAFLLGPVLGRRRNRR